MFGFLCSTVHYDSMSDVWALIVNNTFACKYSLNTRGYYSSAE